jgi:hypothetical protein
MDVKSQSNKARARSRPRLSPATMMWVRKLHLYTGVLFAPTILFFAFTGILQIYDLHEPNPATGAAPSALIARMGNLHKNQTFALPAKDRPKDRAKAKGQGAGLSAPEARPAPKPLTLGRLLLKAFAAAAAVGLAVTTLFGLYMAYALHRNPWLVGGLVAAGVVVPLVLAWSAGG